MNLAGSLRKSFRNILPFVLALSTAPLIAQQTTESAEQLILDSINHERAAANLAPVKLDSRLSTVARAHSSLMVEHKDLSHAFANEPDPAKRIADAGVRFDTDGENVASAQDAAKAHAALMNSPPHKANILNPRFDNIGIGVVQTSDAIFVTEDFAHEVVQISPDEAEVHVIEAIQEIRRADKKKPLLQVTNSDLRAQACDMANADYLSPTLIRVKRASNTIVFVTPDLSNASDSLIRLHTVSAKSFSIGICYSTSKTYSVPAYWVAIVTYE